MTLPAAALPPGAIDERVRLALFGQLFAATPQAVVRDGALAVATRMTATLSADHRVVDGAVAAHYLRAFREALEQPQQLLDGPTA